MDLAMGAVQLISNCRNQFVGMRSDDGLVATWHKIVQEAKTFAGNHNIANVDIVERHKRKRLMPGEMAKDESAQLVKLGYMLQCSFQCLISSYCR